MERATNLIEREFETARPALASGKPFTIGAATKRPQTILDPIEAAQEEVSNLLERIAKLQAQLVGPQPGVDDGMAEDEAPRGVFGRIEDIAGHIRRDVRRAHERLDLISHRLP